MNPKGTDCIAAIATPPGQGAIAIIRVSGGNALAVAQEVFHGKRPLTEVPGYSVLYGKMANLQGEVLDEGLATVFRGPHSYTGEDAVELSCHGGTITARTVLEAVLEAGARQADAGEFTKRAFLNGKMDLSQAEAVADLIAAGSRRAQRASVQQLEGKLGATVNEVREELLELCALLEIDLDFSEEGVELITAGQIEEKLSRVGQRLANLLKSFSVGRIYRDGVSVVLAGKPNAGKSSLFNALLQEERAIVTAQPGTTRDTLEESLSIGGVVFRVTDTAGLREAETSVEAEGVRRARSTVESADIVVLVIDAVCAPDGNATRGMAERLSIGQKLIVACNKADLIDNSSRRAELSLFYKLGEMGVFTSARTGEGVHELKEILERAVFSGHIDSAGELYVTNERHFQALARASKYLLGARESLKAGKTNEFIAFDVRVAVQALSEITGQITTEDILNSIFSRFCVGK
jgi:tRNA modification GTPase